MSLGTRTHGDPGGVLNDRIALDLSLSKEEITKADPKAVAEGIADGIGEGIGDGIMAVDELMPFQYRTSVATSESQSQNHTQTKEQKETEGG